MNVRTRFAPSPTGFVHVGSLLSAFYTWLVAKQAGGKFILRVEDTDQKRSVPGAIENLLSVLHHVNLDPDEGVVLGPDGTVTETGEYGPYTQSQRLPLYRQYVEQLLESGAAYHCFCSAERLATLRAEQEARKELTRYDRACRRIPLATARARVAAGESYVIRQAVPETGEVVLEDLVRGTVKFPLESVDDSVLMKSDGFPTYHLAVVVDDHLMEISHTIRAQEWLPSTPKHLLLYAAFGWQPPQFAHLSNLVNKDRSKLSKRQGDVAVEEYLRAGYLPDALLNFLAITSWNEGQGSEQEIYSRDELIKKFSLGQVHATGAYFNREKLDWMNGVYIRQLPVADLATRCRPYLESLLGGETYADEYIQSVVALQQERLKKLSDITAEVDYFFTDQPQYEPTLLVWKKSTPPATADILARLIEYLKGATDWSRAGLETALTGWIAEKQYGTGDVLWPLRVALSGRDKSPGPFDLAAILGQATTLKRLYYAHDQLARTAE